MGHTVDVPEPDNPANQKIIVAVEDDEHIMELIRDILESKGDYIVISVYNGLQALPAIRQVSASLILLDVRLPGMNGFQIYDALKADPKTAYIPVIFIPATYFGEEFAARGVTRPMIKPFDVDQLLSRVEEAFRS